MTNMIKPNKNGQQSMCPQGNHHGVIDAVIDLGLQRSPWDPDEEKTKHIILVHLKKTIPEGPLTSQPYKVSMILNDSTHEKSKMGKLIRALVPEVTEEELAKDGFDLDRLVGLNGLFDVRHKQGANGISYGVTNVSPLPEGMEIMAPDSSGPLPEWIQKMIDESLDKLSADDIVSTTDTSTKDKDDAKNEFDW